MRLRQLVLACGLASLALSSHVSALGLGEVKLKSTLNQPLQAEVRLLDTRDLTAEQILVTLASPADFERNGVDRLFFYTEFQFAVDLESPDGPKVLITSRNPVREPYLNFLIEARWTAGRLLREYTLLMDLPTFEDSGSRAAVQSAPTSGAQQPARQTTAPAPTYTPSTRTSSGAASAAPRSTISGNSYEVRNNDTLWEVALKARPDSSVTVHQSMMALYKANPDAFIGGNINRLRRGQVLRIPDADEMKSLGRTEAVSQFATASGDAALGAQINASRRTNAARTESTEVSGRVKLAAPSAGSGSGQGSGANDGSGKALESELATTLEELDKSKAENSELSSRVRDLEAQIDTMQRLVDVSNEKMRALQIAAEQKNSETTPAPQANTETPVEPVVDQQPATPVVEQQPAVVESNEESSVAASSEPAVAAPVQTAPEPAKVITRPKPEPSLVDKAIENAPWIGLGVLGLAGAGYVAYRRRKQQQEEEEQEFEQENVFAIDETPTADVNEQFETPNNFNEINEESLFEEEQPESSAVAETGDVVGEADIYIAYGKLDQAEEMLLNALKKDPESTDIRMKLLEVYSQQQNSAGFDKHYAALLPIAGAALLARATELRAGISGAEEFDSGTASSVSQSADDFALDDFNLDDLDAPDTQAPATTYEPGDFDFALDLDDDDAPASANAARADSDEFSLDLEEDSVSGKDADDLSELSLALDGLEADELPEDVDAATAALEDDFNFDLDDDLSLDDELSLTDDLSLDSDLALDDEVLSETSAVTSSPVSEPRAESLDVSADDFNLDMNVDDIDLAALDHEMESLDVDFDDETLDVDSASISDFAAQEIAKDKAEFGLDLDEDMQLDDLSPSSLNLTDDLDKNNETVSFDLGDINADLNAGPDELVTAEDDFDFNLNELDANDEALAELDLSTAFDDSPSSAGLPEASVDLELDDEIPGVASDATPLVSSDETLGTEQHDEDLFSQALSEFSAESDDLDLNEFSSDEAALADLSDDEMDSELDFLADADEAATKLDLARAYIDMGDTEGAKDILSEVIGEGNDDQRKEASELLGRIV